jgi:hypothetical protein
MRVGRVRAPAPTYVIEDPEDDENACDESIPCERFAAVLAAWLQVGDFAHVPTSLPVRPDLL